MADLRWAVRTSLGDYISGLRDGAIEFDGGVAWDRAEFVFPVATVLHQETRVEIHFAGRTAMAGHGGLLWLMVAHPRIELDQSGATITVLDTRDRAARHPLVNLRDLGRGAGDVLVAETELRPEGTWMFEDRYPAGTPFDPVRVTLPSDASHVADRWCPSLAAGVGRARTGGV
jgi:Htaa